MALQMSGSSSTQPLDECPRTPRLVQCAHRLRLQRRCHSIQPELQQRGRVRRDFGGQHQLWIQVQHQRQRRTREDPDGQPWNKKGKIFWLSTFCGNNQVRCPSQGSFFYNNTVYVDESINPEIYMWPDAGDVLICNNLVSMAAGGEVLPTLLEDEGNVFNVSHNLFHPPARIDLDNDLLTNALFLSPQFLATSDTPVQSELNYQPSPASPALSNGVLIFGSDDPWDFLHNNGGQDFFGLPLPQHNCPDHRCLQGSLCARHFWNTSTNQCESDLEACPGDLDGDGTVSVFDLLMLLTALPTTC